MLRQTVTAGFRDEERLRSDAALDVLRGRDDFERLLAGFKK